MSSTKKFVHLNFNLKDIIFSFLNNLDLLHVYHSNTSLLKKYENINYESLKIFIFMVQLKNKKISHEKFVINYLDNESLILKIYNYFIDTHDPKHISQGITIYLEYMYECFSEKNILINFTNKMEVEIFSKILEKLNKKFEYKFYFNNFSKSTRNQFSLNPSFFENMKIIYLMSLSSQENFNELNNYLININPNLNIKEKIYSSKYYNWGQYEHGDISIFNNQKKIRGIHEFSIRNNSDLGREEIREFNEKVPEGFENLIYLKIASGCAVYNYDCVIFKHLQILKGLMIADLNLSKVKNLFHTLKNLIYLKVDLFSNKFIFEDIKFENLKKISINYIRDNFNLNLIDKFLHLEKIHIKYQTSFSFKIKENLLRFDLCEYMDKANNYESMNLALKILEKIDHKFKSMIFRTNKIEDLNFFMEYLEKFNLIHIKDKIISITLYEYPNDSSDDNEKICPFNSRFNFNHLQCLDIANFEDLNFLKYVNSLDKIIIRTVKEFRENLFDLLKEKKISNITITRDNSNYNIMQYFDKNSEHFKSLRNLKVNNQRGYNLKFPLNSEEKIEKFENFKNMKMFRKFLFQ